MKLNKHIIAVLLSTASLVSCNKDLLDRSETTKVNDAEFWRNQTDVRLYANDFYTNFFVGYNSGFGVAFAPLRGYNWADDFTSEGTQASFESTIPTTRGPSSTATALALTDMLTQYSGPSWNFYWIRKANIMLNRIENNAKPNLSQEEYNHWTAVAKFFRAFEYARLVGVFGDVPYFDAEVDPKDFDTMYKPRTPRTEVMDKVYEDCKFVLENMRINDGKGYVGRYTAAALISNWMLFEGSWEHYHNVDKTRAKKFLELAVEASQYVMDSGKYSFGSDFKSLFASEDLSANPEVIFFRSYNDAVKVTHAIGSYSNGYEGQDKASNLNLLKSFICNDGQVWQNSTVAQADNFSMKALAASRDPRFEATFMDTVNTASVTLAYVHKFSSRDALTYIGKTYPAKWTSNTNTNDAPVARLAEVVLNWIEAKQLLAENYGGTAVSQTDLDKSINAIRNRPLDADAIRKGVKKTAPLLLSALPNDPARDGDVSGLMWEIRRERRMEFVYEGARLNDIRRWKKLGYMNFNQPDYAAGPWINALKDLPKNTSGTNLADSYKNKLKVRKADGTVVTFTGTNATEMVGYYMVANFSNRGVIMDRSYMSPVGLNQVQQYVDRGYTLTQTAGW